VNKGAHTTSAFDLYVLVFGLFLGLSLIKFGNPVILDRAIPSPATLREAWVYPWPPYWSHWFLLPLVLVGLGLALGHKRPGETWTRWVAGLGCLHRAAPGRAPSSGQEDVEAAERFHPRRVGSRTIVRWLWILPLVWFGWQLVSATQTVEGHLTASTLWQLGGCVVCYLFGAGWLGTRGSLRWLLMGLVAALALCLFRAVNQRLFEFPQEQHMLLEGERTGWTNFAPEVLARLKSEKVIVTTNGVDVANPFIIAKYAKGRVHGTLVYPNALAAALLLLWPVCIAVAFNNTRQFKPTTRALVVAFTLCLGGAGFFWTGSKFAWLIGIALVCAWLLRLKRGRRWKTGALAGVLVAGLVVFGVRFHSYFSTGAKSAGARLDYWRAAAQVALQRPLTGSGPGTFQRPYSELKAPDAEMARLAHNDFLEQFSDSGIVGGLSYLAWIGIGLMTAWRRLWRSEDPVVVALLTGVVGWFVQGLGEFSLYIPGLAWPAFTLLGWVVGTLRPNHAPAAPKVNQIDKRGARR
jgi:hypothetical protein